MSAINLADLSKNPKDVQKGIQEWEQSNPAEILECMERRGELKSLKAKSYDRVRPVLSISEPVEPDAESGHGFCRGDRVVATAEGLVNASLCGDPIVGKVQGVRGETVRVNGQYYAPRMWKKA